MSTATPLSGSRSPNPERHRLNAVPEVYPAALAKVENDSVRLRRAALDLPKDTPRVGLALSGGGIRSATFNLGFLQGLARGGVLRHLDFLSTVSGGGYIGSFFGAWVHREGLAEVEAKIKDNESPPVDFLRENGRYLAPNGAGDAWVAFASHLRGWVTILLTIGLFILGWLLLGEAAHEWIWQRWAQKGFPESARPPMPPHWIWWSPWWWLTGGVAAVFVIPIGCAYWLLGIKPLRLPATFWVLVASVAAAAVVKGVELRTAVGTALGLAFVGLSALCLSEQRGSRVSKRRRAILITGAVVLLAGAYFFAGGFHWLAPWDWQFTSFPKIFNPVLNTLHIDIPPGSAARYVLMAAAFVGSVVWVAAFVIAARHNDVDYARRDLTEMLSFAMIGTCAAALLALVDTLGGSLFLATGNVLTGHVVVVGLWTVAQWIGPKLLAAMDKENRPSFPLAITAGVGATMLALTLLALLSFWSHTIAAKLGAGSVQWFGGDEQFQQSFDTEAERRLLLAGGGLVFLCALAGRSRMFLNLSSDLPMYTARLTRAYVGASNPRRRHPDHGGVTRPVPDDDVPFTDYHPEHRGGPLHLVNVTINETILGKSQLEQRDRHGISMTLGPRSISVGRNAHALLVPEKANQLEKFAAHVRHHAQNAMTRAANTLTRAPFPMAIPPETALATRFQIEPLVGPAFHPLASSPVEPKVHAVEMRTIGRWAGVSGAAFSTGLGQNTSMGLSFLAGIFNVRLGYWWDSEVGPLGRENSTPLSAAGYMGVLMATMFPAQAHLFDELLARFHGPAGRRFWYLTDGGHFENTAAYELIRRRVPVIIISDCGADPAYVFDDVGNLVRKARIDFGAEIRFMGADRLPHLFVAGSPLANAIGELDELKLPRDEDAPQFNAKHAALAEVFYDGAERPGSLILLVKPTVSGDEPVDILNYRSSHPAFPQEPTVDQFFDEAQWESYRKLGELLGSALFTEDGGAAELVKLQQHLAAGTAPVQLDTAF